ncbi:MAG: hypothetical protein R3338_09005, partial [Thermoanaerobaculia bacterium]|nr:hypothetical protein [Thermoanaerobaculia bacterium]
NRDTRRIMEKMGHTFREEPADVGNANAVVVDPEGTRMGGADPRRGGEARGVTEARSEKR